MLQHIFFLNVCFIDFETKAKFNTNLYEKD